MEQKVLTEFEAMRAEIAQRSSFQHAYFLLNIAASGTVMSFTLTKQLGDTLSRQALLVVPLISFSLFMLWFHQALVISHRDVYIKKKVITRSLASSPFQLVYPSRNKSNALGLCIRAVRWFCRNTIRLYNRLLFKI